MLLWNPHIPKGLLLEVGVPFEELGDGDGALVEDLVVGEVDADETVVVLQSGKYVRGAIRHDRITRNRK